MKTFKPTAAPVSISKIVFAEDPPTATMRLRRIGPRLYRAHTSLNCLHNRVSEMLPFRSGIDRAVFRVIYLLKIPTREGKLWIKD